jgi:hypothetical protein
LPRWLFGRRVPEFPILECKYRHRKTDKTAGSREVGEATVAIHGVIKLADLGVRNPITLGPRHSCEHLEHREGARIQSTILVAFDFSRLSSWSTRDAGLNAPSGANPWAAHKYAGSLSSMTDSSPTAIPTHGTLRPCAGFDAECSMVPLGQQKLRQDARIACGIFRR